MTREESNMLIKTVLLKKATVNKRASTTSAAQKIKERKVSAKVKRGNHSCSDCRYFAAIAKSGEHAECGAWSCITCCDWCEKWKPDTIATEFIKKRCKIDEQLSSRCKPNGMLSEGQSDALMKLGADVFADTPSDYTTELLYIMYNHRDSSQPETPLIKGNQLLKFPTDDVDQP